jgi:cell division protein FtsB
LNEWLRWRRHDARIDPERDVTDARPVAEHLRRQTVDPELDRRVRLRRRAMVLGLGAICLTGTVVAFFGEGGYLDMQRLQAEIFELNADIELRRAVVQGLERDVVGLDRDPMARERVAREELGLVRPGEIDFLLPKEHSGMWETAAGNSGPAGRRP